MTEIEQAQANIANLNKQRQLMISDIQSSVESHGPPIKVINDLVTNRLPAIEAAVADAEANLAAMTA
jgi:hypothetical protein